VSPGGSRREGGANRWDSRVKDYERILLRAREQPARKKQEMFGAALSELQVRLERDRHKGPGGLMHFVRYFWNVLEPSREFVDGWPLHAMCLHLEAVSRGEINRLLINVPPGSMKSLLVNVFWPAWEWATINAGLRYISFSYSSTLTERDNQRFLDLIESAEFQAMYSAKFLLRAKGVMKVSNNKHGWKFASSVRGTGTGERGDRVLCFPEETLVATERGPIPIGEIVRKRLNIRVWSRSPTTGRLELRPVVGWKHNPGSDLVRVNYTGGSVRCTPEHRFWVEGRGWVEARFLKAGDVVPGSSGFDMGHVLPANAVAQTDFSRCSGSVKDFENFFRRKFGSWPRVRGALLGSWFSCVCGKTELNPRSAIKNTFDCARANIKFLRDTDCSMGVSLRENFSNGFFVKMRRAVAPSSILFTVRDILRPRSIFKIGKAAVSAVVVAVADFLPFGNRADESQHHELVGEDVLRLPVSPKREPGVSVVGGSFQEAAFPFDRVGGGRVSIPVGIDGGASLAGDGSGLAVDPAVVGNQIVGEASGFSPDFGAVFGVEGDGHAFETFCLTIDGNHSMAVADKQDSVFIIASNCDDPHNIKEGESQVIREETVRWFKEAMTNRVNHMTKSAIIVIMQRVHEDDVSGTILADGLPYEHLMIPLFYEPGRVGPTKIGWTDPRTKDGENYWPERVPPEGVEEILKMGEFAVAAQYQQRPEPRGGGTFKRDWWKIWEPEDGRYPPFDYIIASCDPAYTQREGNDPAGFVVLGVNYLPDGSPRVFLIAAWRKHLDLRGPKLQREFGEDAKLFLERQKESWGLIEWIGHSCKRFKVDTLLVESKASGITVVQELQRMMFNQAFSIEFVNPGRSDKTVRANRVQHLFSAGMIYRPDRAWALTVEDEMAGFNAVKKTSKYDDLTDAMTQGLWWLRERRYLEHKEELQAANVVPEGIPRDDAPLYPC